MKKTPSAKEYFDAHPHYDNFCPWGGTPWYSEFNDAVMKFAEAYSASSHLDRLREALTRMLVHFVGSGDDVCPECGQKFTENCDTCYVVSEAEAALASTPQNENLAKEK